MLQNVILQYADVDLDFFISNFYTVPVQTDLARSDTIMEREYDFCKQHSSLLIQRIIYFEAKPKKADDCLHSRAVLYERGYSLAAILRK